MEFEAVIGLEIHAQMATKSKLFCNCPTSFGADPNEHTCPVCLGLPGALPVLNEQVQEFAVQLGLATHCEIRLDSQFARKNYFYPDLPKAYQISQYDRPICERGWVMIDTKSGAKRIGITRIHIEEDAGKLVHESAGESSFVDFNRAGTPLLEIVSEPDLRTPEEAKTYMEKLHSLVTYLGVSEGDMEKGQLRCDANVSVRPKGQKQLGVRAEVKNLNSFRFIQQAVAYEIDRHQEELLDGRKLVQETRLWDSERRVTFTMRTKEEAGEYRYFPDPDLPLVQLSETRVEEIQNALPELPDAKQERYQQEHGLSSYDAGVLIASRETAEFFEATLVEGADPKLACNWIMGDLTRVMNESGCGLRDSGIAPAQLAELTELLRKGEISSKIAKSVFEEMRNSGKAPAQIVEEKGLKQVSDTDKLGRLATELIAANPEQVEQYRAGKTKVLGFFVGQMMKQTKGQGNPQLINQLLRERLDA